MKPKNPLPRTRDGWLVEIAAAYRDAANALPFGEWVGERFAEAELFHLAPVVALKFRGLGRSARSLKSATEAALTSLIANEKRHGKSLRNPHLAFAFCYLASQFGLDLLTERRVDGLMAHIETNRRALARLIEGTKPNNGLQPTAPCENMRRRG